MPIKGGDSMDFLGDLLPVLIFIIIPIIRGLNNSNKQKKEYQNRKRTATYQGTQPREKKQPNRSWRELIEEVGKELKDSLEDNDRDFKNKLNRKNQGSPAESKRISSQPIKSITQEKVHEKPIHYEGEYQSDDMDHSFANSSEVIEVIKEEPTSSNAFEFSKDPILQGLIFSEILGTPKCKRRL